MRELRRVNPASVNTAPSIFWDVEGALKSTNVDDSDVKQQMIIVENGVNYNIKRYNDLRVLNERYTMDLKKKLDELESQKKQYENLDAMKKAQTEDSRRIQMLQKEIATVEAQIADKTHYSRKMQHMLQRLKSNQLKFDSHMTGMEETMRNIMKDGADVRLMRRGLDAGLAKAHLVLEETKAYLVVSRKDREVLITQRKVEYRNARILNEWLKEREKMKKEMNIELRGDLTVEEERFLKAQIDEKLEKTRVLQKASEEGLKKLQSMEESFTKLKQVTGVRAVEEMHEKFSNQKSNKLQLEIEVKDAEKRLAAAKKAYNRQETLFQELKSTGGGLAELNRDSINKLEEAFADAKNDQKFIMSDSDRVGNVLLGLHQGATGLLQRVTPYLALADGGVFELTQVGEDQSPWTETVDALTTAEHVLAKMMEAISGDSAPGGAANGAGAGGFDEDGNPIADDDSIYSRSSMGSLETFEEAPNEANNIRIRSKKFIRDMEDNKIDESHIGFTNPFERKEADMDMLNAGNANIGESNLGSSAAGGGGGVGGNAGGVLAGGTGVSAAANSAGIIDAAGAVLGDEPVSRLAVKKISARRSHEAKRKEEMEFRRKRLLDRMENKGGAAGGGPSGGADDALMQTAQLKAQKATAERLCVDKKVPTLPDGVTLRDDPMTKTVAFLNSMPKLT